MDIKEEYNLAGNPWEKEEDERLTKEYNVDMLNLLDICKLHKRLPGGIMSRLKRLGIVEFTQAIRGYLEYTKSDLYKIRSIVPPKTTETPLTPTEKHRARFERKNIPSDILQLQKDVKEIKEDIKKILELMTAVYEFESSQV
jgi:hypothetical protein